MQRSHRHRGYPEGLMFAVVTAIYSSIAEGLLVAILDAVHRVN